MKAAVLIKTGSPLEVIGGIELPSLQPGQVLVKLAYSGVCRSQLMEARGLRGVDHFLPHLMGHEGSGKVLAVGDMVKKVSPGDYVILSWIKGEGCDTTGGTYRKKNTIINGGAVTTFNELSVISENRCVKLPQGVPLDVATLFGCAIPTGAGIIFNELSIDPDDTIAIFGLGGIGLSCLMASQTVAPARTIVVDVEKNKLELAREFGATDLVDATAIDPVNAILELTQGKGVDYSIEAVGLTSSIEQAFEVINRRTGLCIFAGHPKTGDKIRLDPHSLISGKQIRGTWGGGSSPDQDIPRFAALYRTGNLPLEKLLSHRYRLDEINQALAALEKNKIFRGLIEIDPTV